MSDFGRVWIRARRHDHIACLYMIEFSLETVHRLSHFLVRFQDRLHNLILPNLLVSVPARRNALLITQKSTIWSNLPSRELFRTSGLS